MLYVSCYENLNSKPGLVGIEIEDDKLVIKNKITLDGKCNMCFIDNKIYSSIKKDKNYLLIIDGENQEEIECKYFYSYAYKDGNYLYLSSFESGVDALFDLDKKVFLNVVEHKSNKQARSHFIGKYKENIIGVDNGIQQIFIYDKLLNIKKTLEFDDINIRLLSFDDNYLYLNTEVSNELIVISSTFEIVKRIKLTDESTSFSGGNACNQDYVVISLRGEDNLALIEKKSLNMVGKFKCGKMPRDLMFYNDYLLVTCSDDDKIERFKIESNKLILVDKIKVDKPITFSLGGK